MPSVHQFCKRLFLFFAIFWGVQNTHAQIAFLEDSTLKMSAEEALSLFLKQEQAYLENDRLNPGFTNSAFWLLLKSPDSLEKRLVIGNAAINKIDFYKANISSQEVELQYLTGDHFPFQQRPIPNRLFVFPIVPSDSNTAWLLRIEKHHESLQLTARLYSIDEYNGAGTRSALINGALTGVMILILLLGGFLFINTRDKLYLYYVLYLLSAWVWVFADKGYAYQYLWPDFPLFNNRAKPLFFAITFVVMLQFMRAFIGQTKESRWFKWITIIQIVLLSLNLFGFLDLSNIAGGNLMRFLLIIMLPLGLFAFALIVLSLIEKAKEGNTLVWYYIVSVSVYIVFGLFEMFAHSGIYLFSNYYLSNYGLHTGLIVEAIILLYGLANQFNEYRKEKEQLLVAINKKQEEITVKVFETQEQERKKIADQLHDEVGSLLSVVSLNISSLIEKNQGHPQAEGKLQSAFEAIGSAASLVRNISHTLTPIAIEKYGFKRAVDNLIASINTSEKLKIEYVVIGFEQTNRYSIVLLNDIFRSIQEMMSNVIRHSGASHAYLELIEHEDLITIMIEDNGKGMPNQDKMKKGNGLDNIFSRINYFKGKIEINSQPETGTLIVIEIPTNQH